MTTATVLDSSGAGYSVTNSVLDSTGTAFLVDNYVLDSTGSSFLVFLAQQTQPTGGGDDGSAERIKAERIKQDDKLLMMIIKSYMKHTI